MDVSVLRSAAKRIRDEEKPDLEAAKRRLEKASESGGQEEMAIAALVFMRHRTKLRVEDAPEVARWAQGIESPEVADLFAQYVARPLFERAPEGAPVERWAASAEPLLRRLAVRTAGMAVVPALARDEDPLVQEAVVDALRERAQENEKEVFEFLRDQKDAPSGLLRGAAAALSPGYALALTTGRLPPRSKAKTRGRSASEKVAAKKAKQAAERARRERERAERELREAEEALGRARRRVEDLQDD